MFHVNMTYATLLAFALAAASPATAQQTIVPHAQGETALDNVPETVIVTDWAAFDNLDALGIEVIGVPASSEPMYLSGKLPDGVQRVGSLQEPDIEGIAATAPDLVIIASRSRTSYPTISQIAPTIDASVDNEDLIEGVKENLRTYGEIFGVEERAAELIAALDAKVEEARDAVKGKGTGLVIVTNAGRLGVYGPQSRVAWVYDALDIPSVFSDVDDRDHGGDAISFEYLLETNPDWLFVVDRDAGVGNEGSARQALDNELVHRTTFWQNDQIVYLDPQAAYVTMHGYQGLMLMLDQVIEGFGNAS